MTSRMNIFEMINELAVVGTAFLMMAVCTVWYSPTLFGKRMWTQEEQDAAVRNINLKVALTIGAFAYALATLAYVLALVPALPISPWLATFGLALFAGALLAPLAIWKERSVSYFLVNFGFLAVFIMVGSVTLSYWPW